MLPLVYHPSYSFDFPSRHRFPMEKFRLLHQHLAEQRIIQKNNLFRPGPCSDRFLTLAHSQKYLDKLKQNSLSKPELREMGLPWSSELIKRTFISPAGTILTTQLALHHGMACHLAGGTHHAYADKASGFCLLNDMAVAAKLLLQQKGIEKVLIFDCDVHQGDGTASILKDEPGVFTCSIHCEKNFPVRKQSSDLDLGLAPGVTDNPYLNMVVDTFEKVITQQQPDLVIYDAGVDVWEGDPLGRLNISLEGIRQRDHLVLATCLNKKIPVATVIGGGYEDNRMALAKRHAIVIEEAAKLRLINP